jgi:hypothetical protein
MFNDYRHPERSESDGPVHVERIENGLRLRVEHAGREQSIELSYYNAGRLFGTLAFMLGIELPNKIARALKL